MMPQIRKRDHRLLYLLRTASQFFSFLHGSAKAMNKNLNFFYPHSILLHTKLELKRFSLAVAYSFISVHFHNLFCSFFEKFICVHGVTNSFMLKFQTIYHGILFSFAFCLFRSVFSFCSLGALLLALKVSLATGHSAQCMHSQKFEHVLYFVELIFHIFQTDLFMLNNPVTLSLPFKSIVPYRITKFLFYFSTSQQN